MHSRPLLAALAASALLAVTACGARPAESATDLIDVTNCGVHQQYRSPTAAVPYDVSAIEKMFALGLTDRIKGIALPKTVHGVIAKSPYRDDYAKVPIISDGVLAQEPLVAAKADWVFAGWQAGFSPARGVTPESLGKLRIDSYMQEETCYNYGADPAPRPIDPLADTYADLTNLGAIFRVQDRAAALVDGLRTRQRGLEERAARKSVRPSVFVYDSGTAEPYTAGRRAAADQVVSLAGGRSVTHDVDGRWTTVGWESVVRSQPEVIVIVDYDKQPAQQKIDYLRQSSPIKDSPAVRENRIRVVDYAELVASPRNLDAAAALADYLEQSGVAR
ncbi:iron transporter [Tsukamurella pulmonis]|uniref:Iron complex transport system substrate-binding protein n=1 Tax=Tsukamurella pulmonis TaxID=47312 RepID=A0A1H1BUG9_9ACTN|nr:ABC transporter substrate-binding protein [Tsukamurella pulmonis]KXO90199.1 iron transporter [Tsukamurella pulmonis]SDQ55555.1 iron complex transport system substrate-binding protein [Tsukamurella pulmonis]SUP24642.1 vitamin B12-transporter protein BtuF [Tsukamurella pulmonis]